MAIKNIPSGLERDFAPYLLKDCAAELERRLEESFGFGRETNYNLEIINIITQHGKDIFKRLPQEVLRGLSEGQRRNVQASFVARANERAVRQDREGIEVKEIENKEHPLSRWDRQENALEAWARNDGCWHDDSITYLEKQYGLEIAHGSEAKVFRYDGTHVIKAISCPYFQQETLDRISLTNFIFPETGLELMGMGRDAEGVFQILVKQPFIKGEHIEETEIVIKGLEDFKEETIEIQDEKGSIIKEKNGSLITDYYILGDLHDRNVLKDIHGNIRVIDCNLFLNTSESGRGGKWVIPEVQPDEEELSQAYAHLRGLLPKNEKKEKLLPRLELIVPGFTNTIEKLGYSPEAIDLPTRNGDTMTVVIQENPEDPSCLLWNTTNKIEKMVKYDNRFDARETAQLTNGKIIKKGNANYRFSLQKGRIEKINQRKLKLSEIQSKDMPVKTATINNQGLKL